MTDNYVYEALPGVLTNPIRLLHLHGNDTLGPATQIQGELKVYALTTAPQFYALSYVWGSDDIVGTLQTSRGNIGITQSLQDALITLHAVKHDYPLWIDALCINQADAIEKAQQVDCMRDIFQSAACVLAYLGPFAPGEAEAINELVNAFHGAEVFRLPEGESHALGRRTISQDEYEAVGLLPLSHPGWAAYGELIKRPWFRRAWIVQEFCVARELTFALGDILIESSRLLDVISLAGSCSIESFLRPNDRDDAISRESKAAGLMAIVALTHYKENHGVKQMSMLDVMNMFSTSGASQARDKIFALRGISHDGKADAFDSDYTSSQASVAARCSRYLIQAYGYNGLQKSQVWSVDSSIPSWSINLDSDTSWSEGIYAPDSFASGGVTNPQFYWSEDQTFFVPRGCIVESISEVGELRNEEARDSGANLYLDNLRRLGAKALQPYPTGEPIDDVWKRTSVTNFSRMPGESHSTFLTDLLQRYDLLKSKTDQLVRLKGVRQDIHQVMHALIEAKLPLVAELYRTYAVLSQGNTPCLTSKKFLGIVPKWTDDGDKIAVFRGGGPLYVLRPSAKHNQHRLIGECYIHGLMNGEALSWPEYVEQDIFIW